MTTPGFIGNESKDLDSVAAKHIDTVTLTATTIFPTGTIELPAGTAAAPSLTFLGDTDTGVFSTAANNFDITTGGVRRLGVNNTVVDIDAGTGGLDVDTAGPINLDSSQAAVNAIRVNASNAAGGIDVDAGTAGIAVDTTGPLSLDSSSTTAASNLTHVGAAGFDLNVACTAGSLNLTAGETQPNAIRIDASAGGIDVDAFSDINVDTPETITMTGGPDFNITANDAGGRVTITAGTSGVNFSTTGQTQLDGATFQAGAIAGVTILANSDSGTWFTVAQTSAYAITLPDPPVAGVNYKFMVITAGANVVTISNGSAHLFGTIINDITSVIPATGTTLTLASAVTAVGDNIEIYGLDATHYMVKAVTSAAGGITIT